MPNSSPPSSGRQYSPDGKSNAIGVSANAGCSSVTATWCRTPPAGMRDARERADRGQLAARPRAPPRPAETVPRDVCTTVPERVRQPAEPRLLRDRHAAPTSAAV